MDILQSKFNKEALLIIKNASDELSSERNPRSHYESLTMERVINLRRKLIRHLNLVINVIFN